MEISGDFPVKGVSVVFDFGGDEDEMWVHLTRKEGKGTICGYWKLKAVEDRDSKGLDRFKEFAESLGIKGHQLAHLISGLKPS
ncbi:MAG TPA: hypothetical protein VMR46_03005 [Candidatus Paceibacterota bacterium]|nr:hypothetical protein [Candidatus Paceibacterota bacterium]